MEATETAVSNALLYVLPIVAALLWAGSLVAAKRGFAVGGSALGATVASAAVGVGFYWSGLGTLALAGQRQPAFSATAIATFALSGLLGTTIARLLSNVGVDRLGASINAAGISTRPLFATLLALLLLGEAVALSTAIGVGILVAGLIVLSISRGGNLLGWSRRDIVVPLLAAALYAASDVVRRFGLTETPTTALEAVALHETAGLALLLGYAGARGRVRQLVPPRAARGPFLLGGVLFAVAMLLFVEALRLGPVAIVASLAGTVPLFVLVLSYLFLPTVERITRGTVLAAACIVCGSALIVL
jgi:drug/metabolite transporter (DMT)-like permease